MNDTRYIASVSFGKDSLAMLLRLLEDGEPLDEVLFYDTGMEFNAIYNVRDRITPILRERSINYIELKPPRPFEFDMLEKPVYSKKNGKHSGYGWCGGVTRWGTTTKTKALDDYAGSGNIVHYVGIAADETKRIERNLRNGKTLPLLNWGMTEVECLSFCYAHGFFWEEGDIRLYDVLDRVSCWCCCNKNLKELRNMRRFLPSYWERLKELQRRIEKPMKGPGKSVFDLDERFSIEAKDAFSQITMSI